MRVERIDFDATARGEVLVGAESLYLSALHILFNSCGIQIAHGEVFPASAPILDFDALRRHKRPTVVHTFL